MKRLFKLALCSVLLCAVTILEFSLPSTAVTRVKLRGEYAQGEVIVKLKSSAESKFTDTKKAAAVYGNGMSIKSSCVMGRKDNLRFVTIKNKKKSTAELIESLRRNDNVEYVMPNYVKHHTALTNDNYVDYQWALENNGNENGIRTVDTAASSVWDSAAKSAEEQVVAVIDSGIDLAHEDLADVLWTNPFPKKLKGVHGYDFTNTVKGREPVDDDGHGTHVAGIIAAASNNAKGVSGINNSNVRIMALKASHNGDFYSSDEMKAYEYIEKAAELGVNIAAVNCSFGGEGDLNDKKAYDSIYDRLGELGIVTCIASGNEYTDLSDHSDGVYLTPACTDSKYAVTVGACNERDEMSRFSNYSTEYVDIAAPGSNILSTWNENTFQPSIYDENKRSGLCAYYQSYDSDISEGDFGMPKIIELDGKVRAYYDDNYFGKSGRALSVEPEKSGDMYILEFPYTPESESGDYYVSFMGKSPAESDCYILDVPEDFDSEANANIIQSNGGFFGSYGSDGWDHFCYKFSTDSKGYLKGKNRKIVMLMYNTGSEFYFDDLAVSVMNPNEEEFGKYEFSNGTSMATPFVAGAAALVKNLSNKLTPVQIIAALKNTSRYSPSLSDKVNQGASLYLGTIKDYIGYVESVTTESVTTEPVTEAQTASENAAQTPTSTEPYVPYNPGSGNYGGTDFGDNEPEYAPNKTVLTLFRYSKSLYVGKKYFIETNIEYEKGTTTFKSSNPKVAKVSAGGTVKALKKGTAYITVKNNGSAKTLKIVVKNPKLNIKSKTLTAGRSFKLKIIGRVGTAKFKSSNKKVAVVTKSGKIKAKKKGRAVITVVTNGKIKLKCKIKVK